mgnify:CR=1 FL=1
MENMEMVNEVAANDAVQEMTEAVVSNKGGGLKTGLAIGGAMVAGALLWDRVLKPVGKKFRVKLLKKKAAKAKKPRNADSDPMEVDDVQPIE